MFLKTVAVRGFRAAGSTDMTCTLPGRFTLLVGGNNAGKTTICEAIYLAHRHRFPQLPRPSAELLRRARDGERDLRMEYALSTGVDSEGLLGKRLLAESEPVPAFSKLLTSSLGRVRVSPEVEDEPEGLRVIYLPAHRNPIDELARRDAMAEFQAAKLASNAAAIDAVDLSLTLCGGSGYSGTSAISRLYRDVRAGPFMQAYSPNEAYDYIGQVALGYPPDVLGQ